MFNILNEFKEALEDDHLREDYLFEMSNIRAKDCEIAPIDFSFYFGSKQRVGGGQHGIRVKVSADKSSMSYFDGNLELFDDYKFTYFPNHPNRISGKMLKRMRTFFKRYKVIFAAVWEDKLPENDAVKYFGNNLSFNSLLNCFCNLSEEEYNLIQGAVNIKNLEKIVRENNIFNMND